MAIEIVPYSADLKDAWTECLADSRNGIFQFDRGYVEHHADRFTDFSFCLYVDGKISAIFPASIDSVGSAVSHAGLTFGGLIFRRGLRGSQAIELASFALAQLPKFGAQRLTVKLVPPAFWSYPSGELDYALWRGGGKMIRRDLSSLLPTKNAISFNSLRRRSITKAKKAGVTIENANVPQFIELVGIVLRDRHGVDPVHSVDELTFLVGHFPDQIEIVGAKLEDDLVACALVYKYQKLWHFQNLASGEEGRASGALDLIIADTYAKCVDAGVDGLSFGTSTTEAGKVLNEGLLWQKESFGARSITHDFMAIEF